MPLFSTYTFRGMLRAFRCFVLRREPVVKGMCLRCGACCRNLCLHVNGHWIRDKEELKTIQENHPEYRQFHANKKHSSGLMLFNCDWLADDNTCMHYDRRPDICRTHPVPTIWFTGAIFPPSCGFRIEEVPSFKRVMARARKNNKRS